MVKHFRLQRARLGGRVFSVEDFDAFVYLIKAASAGFHVAHFAKLVMPSRGFFHDCYIAPR